MIKPILFNTDMVRAILDGRKTVTRRLIKPPKDNKYVFTGKTYPLVAGKHGEEYLYAEFRNQSDGVAQSIKCPYRVNDILYVRETWGEWTGGYIYKAWNEPFPQAGCHHKTKWHPSIHMPKEAARVFLKVTDVRVERLQNMTLNDFLNEGVSIPYEAFNDPENAYMQAKKLFMDLWDSTIKQSDLDRYGWNANPWVWVIEIEQCKKPQGYMENKGVI